MSRISENYRGPLSRLSLSESLCLAQLKCSRIRFYTRVGNCGVAFSLAFTTLEISIHFGFGLELDDWLLINMDIGLGKLGILVKTKDLKLDFWES